MEMCYYDDMKNDVLYEPLRTRERENQFPNIWKVPQSAKDAIKWVRGEGYTVYQIPRRNPSPV